MKTNGYLKRKVVLSVTVLLLLLQQRVSATNHGIHMEEVMVGANGNSRLQFIVIHQEDTTQNFWGPQFGETQSRAMLVFFDATGRETGKFKFPMNPPTGGTFKTLIATQEFANLPGAPAPDIIIPPLLHAISGKVCFKGNPANTNAFPRNECLSYGSFTGDTETNSGHNFLTNNPPVAAGPPAPALPIVNTVSLKRNAETDRNVDFAINNTPTPTNIAGATFTIPVASQAVQGANLFNFETFEGNGRTCASCHVASTSLAFTPPTAQARFATLAQTFDPQFIGETAPSAFDAGFDFNLNMLVVTAAVSSNAPCAGELRGIVTTPNSGRAKIFTKTSPTTYLVYGGRSPILSGVVSDSNSCSATVSSITAGSLGAIAGSPTPGLEDPSRMRRSGSPDFPQGRALILENIDGFPPTPNVFRKSPHLLNLSRTAPFGFSGDIPNLQEFANGAVQQHFPRSLTRTATGTNPDFRLPQAAEKAAMEAFMLAQEFPPGNDANKFDLSRFALTAAQQRGQTAFFGDTAKCSQCHGGPALSVTTVNILGKGIGVNAAFNTGVVNQSINSAAGDNLPCEKQGGTGACGSREFSTPQLFNVKNLAPFFHDASVPTLRKAVEFYDSPNFNNSPAGVAISGITLTQPMIDDITAFLEGLTVGTISSNSTTSLTGTPGVAVSPAPSVLVRDGGGAPQAGVTVTFAITAGSGSLTGATQTTNVSGVATVGNWVLGTGVNTLTATATGTFTDNPVTFTATGVVLNNDNFANRFTLAGNNITTTGSNVGMTAEAGEPGDNGVALGTSVAKSVWWTWSAPCSFTVSSPASFIDTIGSNFDTVLDVFTGSTLSGLTLVAGDDESGGANTSRVPSATPGPSTLNIVSGTVFQIRVRDFFGSSGNITLHINTSCGPPPPTISSISPNSGVQGSTVSATIAGANLTGATAVTFSGSGVTAAIGSGGTATSLPVSIAIASGAATGLRTFTVTASGSTSPAFSGFTVVARPTITLISPNSSDPGTTFAAMIVGSNLSGATAVTFSGLGVTATVGSGGTATTVPVSIAIASGAATGLRTLTVTATNGTSESFSGFTVNPPGSTTLTSDVEFSLPDRGGLSFSASSGAAVTAGYATIQPDTGKATPTGAAIFGFRSGGVLINEAAVPATPLFQNGRMAVQVAGSVATGIAIANPNNQSATLSFSFTNTNGTDFGAGSLAIPANGQIASFFNQAPFNGGATIDGTFSFSSNVPVSAVGLRGLTNERSEFLLTTLPVLDTSAAVGNSAVALPLLSDGGGWTTQIVLVNPTDATMSGSVQIRNLTGTALTLTANGQSASSFSYTISRRSSFNLLTAGAGASLVTGSVLVAPNSGNNTPVPMSVLAFRGGGVTVSQSGVPFVEGTALRAYAEASAVPFIDTGIALANASSTAVTATLELTGLNGAVLGTATASVAGNGQTAGTVNSFFPAVPLPLKGVVRITAPGAGVSVVTALFKINERGDQLLVSTTPVNEGTSSTSAMRVFPHFAIGGGFSTQFALVSGPAGATSGHLRFKDQAGAPLNARVTLPAIAAISPDTGAQSAAVAATITGTRLSGATAVTFSGSGVTATIGSGGTAGSLPIAISVASGASLGLRTVKVTTPEGTSSSFSGFTVGTSGFSLLSPANGATGVSPTATLTWQSFTGAASFVVHIGTTNPPSSQNDQTVTGTSFTPSASVLGPLGTGFTYFWSVEAVASGGARTLNTGGLQSFTVAGPGITGINPTSGNQNSTVQGTISGMGLSGATAVTFSGSGVTAAIGSGGTATSLPVSISIAVGAATGLRTLTVTTPGGTSSPAFSGFTVTTGTGLTPVISDLTAAPSGLSQAIAPLFGGPFTLTVNGQNFDSTSAIKLGSTAIATSMVSATQVQGAVTTALLAAPVTSSVTVTNSPNLVSNAVNLKIVERGDTNGNRSVNIGDALVCALTTGGINKPPLPISVGDLNLNGSVNIGDCLVGALFSGGVNPNMATPIVTSVSPSTAVAGSALTITGTGLAPGTTTAFTIVSFTTTGDGVTRVAPTAASPTSVTVTVPGDAITGPMQVYRTDTPLGGAEFPLSIGSGSALALTNVSPFFGVTAGNSLTLTGMGFSATAASNAVTFTASGGTSAGTVTGATTTSLTVTVPSGAVCGPVTVTVAGQTSNARMVTISGTSCGVQLIDIWGGGSPGEIVVLEGAGFDAATPANNVVRFMASGGGTVTAPVVAAGRTQLHVKIPDTATEGNVTVQVGSTTSNGFLYRPPSAMTPSSVNVMVNSTDAFGAYQVTVNFNKNLVTVSSSNVRGGTCTGFTSAPSTINIDNNAGTLTLNSFITSNFPSGQCSVANVTFTPVAVGTSNLTLSGVTLSNTAGNDLPASRVSLSSGSVTVLRVP